MVTSDTKGDASEPTDPTGSTGPTDPTGPGGDRGFGTMVEEEPEFASEYSKDYWDLVFEQLGKRTLFKAGMVVLTLLYGIAVFAPMLANDRPYRVESVDLKGYASALRVLRPMATTAAKAAKQTEAEYADALKGASGGAAPTRLVAAEVERDAALLRIATMRTMLPADETAPLDEYADAFQRGIDGLESGDDAAALAALDEAKTIARGLRRSLKALDPAKPDAGGVPLLGRAEQPLYQSIAAWEVVFMALWVLSALWPLWNWLVNTFVLGRDRDRIRVARRYKLVACFGIAFVSAIGWRVHFGPVADFDVATHKRGLTDGSIVLLADGKTTADLIAEQASSGSQPAPGAASVVGELAWAPVPFGYAELHEDESFRPPTWNAKSERDPETGRPVHLLETLETSGGGVVPSTVKIEVRVGESELNGAWRHPLGTDESGRDVLSRMIWGGRVSLSVGILSAALLTVIGVIIGSIAGYFGGWVDIGIMRGIEILQSIPAFFLILLALAFTDPNVVPPMFAIVLVIALVRWTGVARLVRGEFLRLREQEFVVAAQALGFSSARTIFKHVLPNAMSPVLVAAAFSVAAGILTESAVSFLGFGIREPDASWGAIVNESRNPDNWWIQLFPGIAIFVTVTCYNLAGDAIRDAMDPKMKV